MYYWFLVTPDEQKRCCYPARELRDDAAARGDEEASFAVEALHEGDLQRLERVEQSDIVRLDVRKFVKVEVKIEA